MAWGSGKHRSRTWLRQTAFFTKHRCRHYTGSCQRSESLCEKPFERKHAEFRGARPHSKPSRRPGGAKEQSLQGARSWTTLEVKKYAATSGKGPMGSGGAQIERTRARAFCEKPALLTTVDVCAHVCTCGRVCTAQGVAWPSKEGAAQDVCQGPVCRAGSTLLLYGRHPAQGACSSGALEPWPEEQGCWGSHWVKDQFLGDRGQRADATPGNISEAIHCLSAASGQCERPSRGPVFQARSRTDNSCYLPGSFNLP